MKVIDVYPQSTTPGHRSICEGRLSPYVVEVNESRRERYRKMGKEKRLQENWWTREQARREKYKIDPNRCKSFARYLIDGHWFCRKHGAFVVLDALASQGSVTIKEGQS